MQEEIRVMERLPKECNNIFLVQKIANLDFQYNRHMDVKRAIWKSESSPDSPEIEICRI
jgi:hypothetical protein